MAKMKPPQLKLSSAADAIATPACSSSAGVKHEPRRLYCNDAGRLCSVDYAAAKVNKSRVLHDDTKGAVHPDSREAGNKPEAMHRHRKGITLKGLGTGTGSRSVPASRPQKADRHDCSHLQHPGAHRVGSSRATVSRGALWPSTQQCAGVVSGTTAKAHLDGPELLAPCAHITSRNWRHP